MTTFFSSIVQYIHASSKLPHASTTDFALNDAKPAVRLWVPVPQHALDYQRVIDLTWKSPVAASVSWQPMQGRRAAFVAQEPEVVPFTWQVSQLRMSCG